MQLTITETSRTDKYGPPVFELELAEGSLRDGTRTVLSTITAIGKMVTIRDTGFEPPLVYHQSSHSAAREMVERCADYRLSDHSHEEKLVA